MNKKKPSLSLHEADRIASCFSKYGERLLKMHRGICQQIARGNASQVARATERSKTCERWGNKIVEGA